MKRSDVTRAKYLEMSETIILRSISKVYLFNVHVKYFDPSVSRLHFVNSRKFEITLTISFVSL